MSVLGRQIARSIREQPDRWAFKTIWLERDDGVKIVLIKPFDGSRRYAAFDDETRGRPLFGWLDRRMIQRAFSEWQMRPLPCEPGATA